MCNQLVHTDLKYPPTHIHTQSEPSLKKIIHVLVCLSSKEALIMGSMKMRVSLVGLGFGAEFIPIYQAHPLAEIRLLGNSTSDAPNPGRYASELSQS